MYFLKQIFLCGLFVNIFFNSFKKGRSSLFLYLCIDKFECFFEDIESLVDFFIRDNNWWFYTNGFCTIERTADEDTTLKQF